MAISENQLELWSHQGSITQSAATYQTIRSALTAESVAYRGRGFKVFLQGSYGNDTNIYSESDVDVVICLDDAYFSDVESLTPADKQAYDESFFASSYSYAQFKSDVVAALTDRFGSAVALGDKAITITANGSRRKADVIVAMQFRRYWKFKNTFDQYFDEGICFFNRAGQRIANYPKQHSANLTKKHQATSGWFKPMVRISKNLRSKLVSNKLLDAGMTPSYYLEGLFYNVPDAKFGSSFQATFIAAMNWIVLEAEREKLVCANEQYYLLWEGAPTSWEKSHAEKFLDVAVKYWNDN